MPTQDIQQVERVWPSVAEYVFVPHTEEDYRRLVALLDTSVDAIGEDKIHPRASLMGLLDVLIEKKANAFLFRDAMRYVSCYVKPKKG
jgi:HTH-type transcriptional regulator / antitoxin HigA